MEMNIDLNELICDNLTGIALDIINCDVDRAILKGGRASTKSQVVSECIVVGCMSYKESAVALVRYGNKIEERLVNTFRESIHYMGLEKFWKLRRSPFEYVLLDDNGKETDVSIKFTGCDRPEDLKSYKPRRGGGFRYVWMEELSNFDSLKSVNNLIQTFARGEGKHCVIMSYNPPKQNSNWVNKEFNAPKNKDNLIDSNVYSWKEYFDFEIEPGNTTRLVKSVNHSTYLDVIANGKSHWLGDTFIGEAKQMEAENYKEYQHQYLGEVVGTDANVFNNIKDWDGDINKLDITEVFRGLDFGLGGPDPTAFVAWYYDRKNKRIYCLDEFSKSKMSVDEMNYEIRLRNKNNFPVYFDSATPILGQELINKGCNAIGAIKGPDSVRAGIKWLQSLNGIHICKTLTPIVYHEFTEYEYIVDKDDNVTSKLVEGAEHTIDSTRYAFNLEIKYA